MSPLPNRILNLQQQSINRDHCEGVRYQALILCAGLRLCEGSPVVREDVPTPATCQPKNDDMAGRLLLSSRSEKRRLN